MLEYIAYVAAGALISTLGSMSGVGGGVFMVPLFYHIGYPLEKAIGTSLLVIVFNAVSSTIANWRRGLIGGGPWVVIAILMIPFSMIGAYLVIFVPRLILATLVSLIVISYGANLIRRSLRGEVKGSPGAPAGGLRLALLAGVAAGIVAGLTGIGGGSIIMPIFLSAFKMDPKRAVAASMMSITMSSLFGSMVHVMNDNVVYSLALPFAAGAILGGQIGSYVVSRARPRALVMIIGIVLILAGSATILRYLSSLNY